MAEIIGHVSMIKKTCYQQLYDLTYSFEQVLWNVTHRIWVTFTLSEAASGLYKACIVSLN